MPVSPRSFFTPLWLGVSDLSCPSINRFHHLLATRADSESLLRGDRARRRPKIKSIHLIDLVSTMHIFCSGASYDESITQEFYAGHKWCSVAMVNGTGRSPFRRQTPAIGAGPKLEFWNWSMVGSSFPLLHCGLRYGRFQTSI